LNQFRGPCGKRHIACTAASWYSVAARVPRARGPERAGDSLAMPLVAPVTRTVRPVSGRHLVSYAWVER